VEAARRALHLPVRSNTLWVLNSRIFVEENIMAWTTPTLVEICIGLEINGYLPAEF
jgi:coenzyme PQQ precursor peptide PqqA